MSKQGHAVSLRPVAFLSFLTMSCWRPSTTMHQFQHTHTHCSPLLFSSLCVVVFASFRLFVYSVRLSFVHSNRFWVERMHNYTFCTASKCLRTIFGPVHHALRYGNTEYSIALFHINVQMEMIRLIFINYRYLQN